MKTNVSGKRFYPMAGLKVSLVLVFAVVVTALALWISSKVSREKLAEMTETEVEKDVAALSTVTDIIFRSSEWTVCSFLASWADVSFDSTAPDGKLFPHFELKNVQMNEQEVRAFSEGFRTFLKYNREFVSCVLIFEPQVLEAFPDGISCTVNADTVICLPETAENAYHRSSFYEKTAENRGVTTRAGQTQEDGSWVMTNAVPFYDAGGRRLGECWVDAPIEYISGIIRTYQAETDAFVCLINDLGILISCSDTSLNGQLLEETEACREGAYSEAWCREVRSCFGSSERSVFKDEIFGHSAYTYVMPVSNYPFRLLIVKPEGRIYHTVNGLQHTLWTIMSVAVLVILLCLLYIYLIIKRKNEESRKIGAELEVAASIQQRILPPNPSEPLDPRFDVYGFQRPAKSVGGDLYDYVLKDNLLYFCIGDVSGKGVPAAIIMSELCTLYRIIIRRHKEADEIMKLLNTALMDRSDDSMCCTLLCGVLDLNTGHLEYCNAGHNPPVLIRPSGAAYLKVKPNIVLYAFEDYPYRKECLDLQDGDRLFLYTDGITEAKNGKNAFFGEAAALEAIQENAGKPFAALVEGVLDRIARFTQHAEQHDDMTVLCLEYRRAAAVSKLHYPSVKNVVDIVNGVLSACGRPEDKRLRLALEEPVQNIASYAYADDGPLDVDISKDGAHALLEITLTDSGKAFNPLEAAAPDLSLPIEEREVGGLGIYFTRQIMEDLDYKFENQQNKLTLKYRTDENQCNGKE